ncbi:MAG: hypothetical protein GWO86_02315 [Planctomycetes bacterium]|nr:hypothetical protein [Planctomycetota bacterium]
MSRDAVIKKSNAVEAGPGVAGFIAASVISVLLAGAFVLFCWGPDTADDFVLDGRINPNTATTAQLMQLPRIGVKTARAITEYRRGRQSVFKNIEDLQRVKGIGPKTAERIRQWLVFERHQENN